MASRKWGFWVDMFGAICNPDNMSLQMGPLEYLDACVQRPREMAVLRAVQDSMRQKIRPPEVGKNVGAGAKRA